MKKTIFLILLAFKINAKDYWFQVLNLNSETLNFQKIKDDNDKDNTYKCLRGLL